MTRTGALANRIGPLPAYPAAKGAPAAVPVPGPPRTAVSCAAAESGGSARRAFCSEILLDGDRAPDWIPLFPAGPELAATDGRRWRLSNPQAVARLSDERRGGLDLCIDWEHAQERKAQRGERSDAAAWIKEFAVRDGVLGARVDWTAAGRESVEGRGYRYFSPSFAHARTIRRPGQLDGGEVLAVVGGGLVNRPAFDMPALAGEQQEESMLKKILEALGLASDASEEQAITAIAALKTERDEARSQAASPPMDQFVPRAQYDQAVSRASDAETKLADRDKAARETAITEAVDQAVAAGKIVPATRDWFIAQCRAEGGLEKFKADFVEKQPKIGEPSSLGNAPPGSASGYASAEERSIAGQFGRDAKFLDEHAPVSQGVS